ncbi:MAG: UDP-3-O-(3-hydroxymyristoyl)glucosamine N-acyltransferase, partial [Gammaproteobacteria bacterium]
QRRKYLGDIAASACSAVLLPRELVDELDDRAALISEDPQLSFVRAIEVLKLDPSRGPQGIHPAAQIAASASIGKDVGIDAQAVIGEHAVIGDGSTIGAGCVIGEGVRIGENCRLYSRVTLERDVVLGNRCIVHSGAVIGADGFGLVEDGEHWIKVPQLGSVSIGDDVEIGANTTIDRGAMDDTVIEQGCKLDNQIQVAHNVRIGAHTAIAACVGIAGSAEIGRYCKISGAAVILGHLRIADGVTVTAMSLVTRNIREAGVYSSGTPLMENSLWHRSNARYKMLEALAQRIAALEKSRN